MIRRQRERDALCEIGVGPDRQRYHFVIRDRRRCAHGRERQKRDCRPACRGRGAHHQSDAGVAARRHAQGFVEVETDAALRGQRHNRAGIDERELRRIRREERVLQTEGFEHAPQIAYRLADMRRRRIPGVGFAKAADGIGEQGADPAPFDVPPDVGRAHSRRRHRIHLHDAHQLQQATDLESTAQQVLDDTIIEEVAPDRLLERCDVDAARKETVGLRVQRFDRIDEFPDSREQHRGRVVARVRIECGEQVRPCGREVEQRRRYR